MPKGVNKGVRKLAKKAGVSPGLVTRKKTQGKSDAQIIEEAAARKGKRAKQPRKSESYAEAQARKEKALADLRELELREKQQELISAADAAKAWSGMITSAKDTLMAIGDEICDLLAPETNPIRCRELVNDKVREALTKLSGYPSAA